ncbi:hypothetical protein D7X25_31600 [bacterium 1XD42-8]|jgi:hypothetical protein|nr:hypothetical protein [Lachnospiraceae bacterium]RKJ37833.1 hypothetical protein D7X25_31600 [bacterium 1XD42-8]
MKCPYCNQEMENGTIYGNRYKIKFIPRNKKLFAGIWAIDAIPLGERSFIGRANIPNVKRCKWCEKYLIDVPPLEKV